LEESDLIPEEKESTELVSNNKNVERGKEEVENSSEVISDSKIDNEFQQIEKPNDNNLSDRKSIFRRILENGFDGVTTNPNYKLLALLIILLINLSLFFVLGNLGKSFLKSSGILS